MRPAGGSVHGSAALGASQSALCDIAHHLLHTIHLHTSHIRKLQMRPRNLRQQVEAFLLIHFDVCQLHTHRRALGRPLRASLEDVLEG
eukprot:CAMPEP_0173200846 /NCGR_PEP_ID=MMETSP1141-20130122/18013_1 /TAXON_ID=483371 /ORGANISM="non described non described, Strain CCMP2298" /LENGTH=87 /DNA_ID=CAMNT_0014125883 /DNA_START=336 /DNA_END=599 /DNA_ORIENTATION=-